MQVGIENNINRLKNLLFKSKINPGKDQNMHNAKQKLEGINPQIIKDIKGNDEYVLLPVKKYQYMVHELEELEFLKTMQEAEHESSVDTSKFINKLKKRVSSK